MLMLTSASALGAVAIKQTTATAAARAKLNLFMNPPHERQGRGEATLCPPNCASIAKIGIRVATVTTSAAV
jgi:hypothetical protein